MKPHIVCLCETWLKENRLSKFINYACNFYIRPQHNGGGLALLIRNDVCVAEKALNLFPNGNLEVQALTVLGDKNKIDILNLYNPNGTVISNEFKHYFNQLNNEKVIVGDFNAHNYCEVLLPFYKYFRKLYLYLILWVNIFSGRAIYIYFFFWHSIIKSWFIT